MCATASAAAPYHPDDVCAETCRQDLQSLTNSLLVAFDEFEAASEAWVAVPNEDNREAMLRCQERLHSIVREMRAERDLQWVERWVDVA